MLQGIHQAEGSGDALFFTVSPQRLDSLKNIGTLIIIVHGQFLIWDGSRLCAGGKGGLAAVQGQRQQLVASGGDIYRFKAELFGEGLVGQPGFLLFGAQHTHAGFSLGFGVGDAGFHQRPTIAMPLGASRDPQAVDVQVMVAHNGHPGGFQGGVFEKHAALHVQLPEYVAFLQPARQPLPLGFYSRVGLFAADDAAKVFVF